MGSLRRYYCKLYSKKQGKINHTYNISIWDKNEDLSHKFVLSLADSVDRVRQTRWKEKARMAVKLPRSKYGLPSAHGRIFVFNMNKIHWKRKVLRNAQD